MSTAPAAGRSRRDELLAIAGSLFARRGFKNTTVRDIADAAGILSGSLYHHFDSKESMVDELMSTFQRGLFTKYDEILASDLDARAKVDAVVRVSFDAIHHHHDEVAIFQNDAGHLLGFERFSYIRDYNERFERMWKELLADGVRTGALRADLDGDLTYRFIRDTVWVAVRWYRPDGELGAQAVADQYLAILFDGIATSSPPGARSS